MKLKDEKLVKLILKGKTHYFNTIVERYKDAVFGVALSIMENREDALDVVQETFLHVYQRLDQLSYPEKIASWMLRIARNLCFTKVRQSKRRKKDYIEIEREEGDIQQSVEVKTIIYKALRKLSESNRETVILYYINGYSVKEISNILEVPVGTVVRRLHDSRKKLKKEVIKMVKSDLESVAPKKDWIKKVSELSIYPRIEPEIEIHKLTPQKLTIKFTEFTWFFAPLRCGLDISFGFYDYPERKFTGYQYSWIEKRRINFLGKKAYVIHSAGYTERDKFEGETIFYAGIENDKKIYLGRKVYDKLGKQIISEDFRDKEWDGAEDEPEPMKLSTTNYWRWSSLTQCDTRDKERDCDGPWKVRIGDKRYKCLRVVEFTPVTRVSNHNSNIGVEGFIDIATGRTILFRRYNGSLWTNEKVGKKWKGGTIESLKDCPIIVCDNEKFYLWYDCIPRHVFIEEKELLK